MAKKINIGTQEEVEEEPTDNILRRQKRSSVKQKGDESGPVKDNTLTPRSEGPETRKEKEPVQQEPVMELPVRQEARVPVHAIKFAYPFGDSLYGEC